MPSDPRSDASRIFQCRQCGDCCRGYGGTCLTDADIRAISRFIDENADDFVRKYCRFSGDRPILAQGGDGYCVFWDEVCVIHPVKPRMCREWPFIRSVLTDVANWRIMAGSCPGMRTDISDEAIQACVRRELGLPPE